MRSISRIFTVALVGTVVSICACSSTTQNRSATNEGPSACIQRGDACSTSHDCCTKWCVNGYCALKSD